MSYQVSCICPKDQNNHKLGLRASMFMSVGYTCSVDYLSKERTENKNTAILSVLTKHHANSLL